MKYISVFTAFLILSQPLKSQENTGDTAAIRKFEIAFKQWGGRVKSIEGSPYQSYLLQSRHVMKNYKRKEPKYPIPYIDFVDTNIFNARATRCENQYLIGIFKGAVDVVNELAIRIMANNKTFPLIGNPTKEKNLDKINLSEIYNPRRRINGRNTYNLPLDSIRNLYAREIVNVLYRNIIFHEYCHIRHGHVAYLESLGQLSLNEVNDSSSQNFSKLDSQTLEMDADSYAAAQTLGEMLQMVKNRNLLPVKDRQFYMNWQSAFRLWVTAIYIQWRSLSYMNIQSNFQADDHPLPALRATLILSTIYEIFDRNYKKGLNNEITKVFSSALKDVEFAFNQISNEPLDNSNIRFMFSQDANLQFKRIMNNWNHLRPLLLTYSYSPLAPLYIDSPR